MEQLFVDQPIWKVQITYQSGNSSQNKEINCLMKFTNGYHDNAISAHKFAASIGYAPQFFGIYSTPLGCTYKSFVFIEFINNAVHYHPEKHACLNTNIEQFLQQLHEKEFVHGDLRHNNVLVTEDRHFSIIDWDYSGNDCVFILLLIYLCNLYLIHLFNHILCSQ